MDLISQIAFISDLSQNGKNVSPVHRALEWKDVVIQYPGIIRHMGRFQPFSHHTKRLPLIHAHQVRVTKVPADSHILSQMCSKSISSFRRDFHKYMNTSPFEYLYHVRITVAINLLCTSNLPVQEIAASVGYQSLSSFNRHFRRITGKMPKEIRREKAGWSKNINNIKKEE